jgi:hypothetical protein
MKMNILETLKDLMGSELWLCLFKEKVIVIAILLLTLVFDNDAINILLGQKCLMEECNNNKIFIFTSAIFFTAVTIKIIFEQFKRWIRERRKK